MNEKDKKKGGTAEGRNGRRAERQKGNIYTMSIRSYKMFPFTKPLPLGGSFLFIMISFLSCIGKKPSPIALELDPEYSLIKTISATAACKGPKGDFMTYVQASTEGEVIFRQEYAFKDTPFYAHVGTDGKGYVLTAQDSIADTLSLETVEVLRSHAFHLIQTRPDLLFSDIRFGQINANGISQFSAGDRLGHRALLFYDHHEKVLTGTETVNPFDTTQLIKVIITEWSETDFGRMAKSLKIIQGETDTFYYRFNKVEINE